MRNENIPEEIKRGIEQITSIQSETKLIPLLPPITTGGIGQTPEEQQERYLKALFGRCTEGCIEIRPTPLGGNYRQWLPCGKTSIPNLPTGKNICIGVATRKYGEGGEASVVQIPALWVDIDPGKHRSISEEELLKLLEGFPLKPSMVVHSGGGRHGYWLLETPAGPADIPTIRDINDRLAAHFHGDTVRDASRLLRLPGTMNVKYNPPRPARLLYAYPGILYQLSDFDFLPSTPQSHANGGYGAAKLAEPCYRGTKAYKGDTNCGTLFREEPSY